MYNIPCILTESSDGLQRYHIEEKMLARRQVVLSGEVNGTLVNSVIIQLLYLAGEDPEAPITLYIDSPGGGVSSGLALYDVMQAIPCPVNTVCMGLAASMGAVLFAAGARRALLPHSRVMIHDPLVRELGGSALAIQSYSEDLMRTRETIATLLSHHTGKTLEEIYQATAKDTYFYAQTAIEFGLADEILTTF